MSDISPSSIREDAELTRKISEATSGEEIKAILRDAALAQHLVEKDPFDEHILTPVEQPVPSKFATSITNDKGQKLFFEGDSELDLQKRLTNWYREQMSQPAEAAAAAAKVAAEQPRNNQGQFQSQADHELDVIAKADLELKFKRGEISTDDYLAASGAIERHLEAQGISVEVLRETSQAKQVERVTQGWEQATNEFLRSVEGSTWLGGDENKNTIGKILEENKLVDAEDKVGALKEAFRYMQENDLVVVPRDVAFKNELEGAKSAGEVQEITRRYSGTSGIFNR